jgi:hypothetical protein
VQPLRSIRHPHSHMIATLDTEANQTFGNAVNIL